MNEHRLSRRLEAVSAFIPIGSRIADIGTDHAYLPIHLALQGKISSAIATDIHHGPYQSALENVQSLDLAGCIDVRFGDGFHALHGANVDVVVIAGMGAALIQDILEDGLDQLAKVQRLVLQPNVATHFLRDWFLHHSWQLQHEVLLEEDNRFYEVLVAERGDAYVPYAHYENHLEMALFMGPYLLREQSHTFHEKWKAEWEKRKIILDSLKEAKDASAIHKRDQVKKEMAMIEEGLGK